MNFQLIFVFFLILIIGFLINRYFLSQEKLKNIEKKADPPLNIKNNFQNKDKILQYFGGDYCPFSNIESNAYKVIKDFEDEYGNRVTVNYYWVGKDDDYMRQLNIEYVPAILNGDNESIDISLPEGTDTKNMSTNELKEILLETIYNKL
jgi:hypothetical protein